MCAKSKNYYIGFCFPDGAEKEYACAVPGDLKMKYVASKFGGDLTAISLAPKKRAGRGRTFSSSIGTMKTLLSFGTKNALARKLNELVRKIYLFFLFRFKIRACDNVLIYHSTYTMFISRFCPIRRRHIVLEVEEIYGHDALEDKPYLKKELAAIKRFEKFVMVNDYIALSLGIPQENCVVSYGVADPGYQKQERQFDRAHIHVLYAGTISERKSGAFAAVRCAEFLPEQYRIHIAGFGSENAIRELREMIDENNRHDDRCRIEFHGMLKGAPLDALLDSCDIGISTYVMRPDFANHSCPSKLMTYATHGLKVVSGYSDALGMAEIARNWSFFRTYDPKEIAAAIERASEADPTDYKTLLRELDDRLVDFLRRERFLV